MIYVSITKQLMHYCYSYDTSKYSTNLKSFVWGGSTQWSNPHNSTLLPVADPELQIRGGGGGGGVTQKFFSALRASFWLKNKGRGAGPPGPCPGSATALTYHF